MPATPAPSALGDDHSGRPAALLAALRGSGVDPRQLEKDLPPLYALVWRDIALGYCGMFGCLLAVGFLAPSHPLGAVLTMLAGAVGIGLFMAYLQLFTHEAAHRNIAPSFKANDRLANLFLTLWVGQEIGRYRQVHFAHHRYLGEVEDPERSYFQQPSWRLLLETLLLVHLWRVFRQHGAAKNASPAARSAARRQLLLGALLNAGVVLAAWAAFGWPAAGAWVLGVLSFFPVFGTWRQLLEHRSPEARAEIDYSETPHGAFTRSFGTSLGERIFGGAGFNRHLLHHWLPQISYTRFDELERRLAEVPEARDLLAARRSGYLSTLRRLWTSGRRAA